MFLAGSKNVSSITIGFPDKEYELLINLIYYDI